MVCLGFEPGMAGWKARTNPLSYGGAPELNSSLRKEFQVHKHVGRYNDVKTRRT